MEYKNLPENVKKEVAEVLKGWTKAYVEKYDDGHYEVSTSISLTAHRQPFKVVADIKNTDIYTAEERKRYAEEYWGDAEWY